MRIYNINNFDGGDYTSLKEQFPDLFEGIIHHNARSYLDLNFLNIDDQLANRHLLEGLQSQNLDLIIRASYANDYVLNGLKSGPDKDVTLPAHLSLLNMGQIDRVTGGAGGNIISGCLRDRRGWYTKQKSGRRLFDCRAANDAIDNHFKRFDFSKMNSGRRIMQVVFLYPSEGGLLTVGDHVTEAKDLMDGFYNSVHKLMVGFVKDKHHPVQGFIQSNEISCHSIRNYQFKPHVHVVMWIEDYDDFSFLEELRVKQEDKALEGNREFHLKWRIEDELTTFEAVRSVVAYIGKCASLAQVYRREYKEEGLSNFNRLTIESLHKLHWLWSGEAGRSMQRKFLYRVAKINKDRD